MTTYLIFKTNVTTYKEAVFLKRSIDELLPEHTEWNFDLEDIDKILRIPALVSSSDIIKTLNNSGYFCAEL
ncbi:hypothetical protein ACG2LH_10330 [Zhouia sp. PK063]|uniref:hypothetical protein n=1 Tax=Zhouia sp. PK063 TaxID=3373602 RepID=UPI003788637A